MDDDTTDRDLVAAVLDGDRAALAGIYDRYADRVHDMCLHMLGDRDEAADVTAEVFLVAVDRLDRLRDPDRLRSWLFAIARHEVYRRTRRRSRTRLVEEVDEMDRLLQETDGSDDATADPAALAALLRTAAAGLDDTDRLVMELQLQGLDGEELAAALGTSVATGYQRVHRMKDRLERSVGAVLVARQGRADCADLDRVLAGWDGTFSVLWRKRVARHVDGCAVCERRRKAVPAAIFGGAAMAVPMLPVSAVSAAPASVRDRVLSDAAVGGPAPHPDGGRWRDDGFPPADGSAGRPLVAAIAAAAVVLLALGAWWAWPSGVEEVGSVDATTTSTSTTTGPDATTTTVPAPAPPVPVPTTPAVAPTTTAPRSAPTTTAPPRSTPPVAPTTTVAAPPLAVSIRSAPSVLYRPTPDTGTCGASDDVVVDSPAATGVEIRWDDASGRSGTIELARSGDHWRAPLELPDGGKGPATIRAVARDAAGGTATSAEVVRPIANCPTPG